MGRKIAAFLNGMASSLMLFPPAELPSARRLREIASITPEEHMRQVWADTGAALWTGVNKVAAKKDNAKAKIACSKRRALETV